MGGDGAAAETARLAKRRRRPRLNIAREVREGAAAVELLLWLLLLVYRGERMKGEGDEKVEMVLSAGSEERGIRMALTSREYAECCRQNVVVPCFFLFVYFFFFLLFVFVHINLWSILLKYTKMCMFADVLFSILIRFNMFIN